MSQGRRAKHHHVALEAEMAQIVHAHVEELSLLPAEGWFKPSDLDDEVREAVMPLVTRLSKGRAIQTREADHDGWKRLLEYRLSDRTLERVEDGLENRDTICPCGHRGLLNHGDYYECTFELCNQQFSREELNA